MEVVKWHYKNPYHDNHKDSERTFMFGDHVVKLKQQPNLDIDLHKNTGFLIWDGAYIMAKFIYNTLNLRSKTCLELGAGSALVSILTKVKGAKHTIATDLEDYQEFMCSNINCNSHLYEGEIEARVLKWGVITDIEKVDVVFGSEILYLCDLHNDLISTLINVMHAKSVAYFIYKERGLGEEHFAERAKARGLGVRELSKSIFDLEFRDEPYHLLRLALNPKY